MQKPCESTFVFFLFSYARDHNADVSPHLIFKNGMTPTLWPQDVPFPEDGGKEEVASTFGDAGDSAQGPPDARMGYSPDPSGVAAQYPAYFKDAKGMNHSVFGAAANFGALHYLKQVSCEFRIKQIKLYHFVKK